MATANGADFATQCYRHGVLIGNWNEDQHGCDILRRTEAANASGVMPSRLHYPETTTHSTFTSAGHDIVRASVFEEKTRPRQTDIDRGLLFAHKGAQPMDRRYQTSYLASYSCGVPDVQPSVDRTVRKVAHGHDWEHDEGSNRHRSYRTSSSDAFNTTSSVLVLPPGETTQTARGFGGVPPRSTVLAQSLEANYRNLRLRKD